MESRNHFRVQVGEDLQYASPGGAFVRSLGHEIVEFLHVDYREGEIVVGDGSTVVGLFDGADDAFAELHPHVALALPCGFPLLP